MRPSYETLNFLFGSEFGTIFNVHETGTFLIPPSELKELEEELFAEEEQVGASEICSRCGKVISQLPQERSSSDESLICLACQRRSEAVESSPLATLPAVQNPARLHGFDNAVETLIEKLRNIVSVPEHQLVLKTVGDEIWDRVVALGDFLELSEEHDELIVTFQQVACSESNFEFSQWKAESLLEALELLGKGVLSRRHLTAFYSRLETGKFDLNYMMAFFKEPEES